MEKIFQKDDEVYFLVDLLGVGGSKFIGHSKIIDISNSGKWVKLASGFSHRIKQIFRSAEQIPGYESMRIHSFFQNINNIEL